MTGRVVDEKSIVDQQVIFVLDQPDRQREKLISGIFKQVKILFLCQEAHPNLSSISDRELHYWKELLRRNLSRNSSIPTVASFGSLSTRVLTGKNNEVKYAGLQISSIFETNGRDILVIPDNISTSTELKEIFFFENDGQVTITKEHYLDLISQEGLSDLCKSDSYLIYKNARYIFNQSSLYYQAYQRQLSHLKGVRGGRKYICASCKKSFVKKDTQLDHKEPVIEIGKSSSDYTWYELVSRVFCDIDNLEVLCKNCHNKKSAKEAEERAKIRRERKKNNE